MYHQNHQLGSGQSSQKRGREDSDDSSKQTKKRCKYFYPIARDVWDSTSDKHEKWVEHYENQSGNYDAEKAAFDELENKHTKYFFRVYKDFLVKALYTRKSRLHQKVLEYATRLHKNGVPADYAVKLAIREHRMEFEAPEFVKHAATEGDSEDEQDEDDETSEESSDEEEEVSGEENSGEENSGEESDEADVKEDKASSNSSNSGDSDD